MAGFEVSPEEVYAREPRALRVGDMIRWTRNDHPNERINAEVGRVVAIDREQHRADVLVNGGLHKLDLDRQGHWELAYATTIHAAQGRTSDRVLLHLDASKPHLISHEGWYVGISRARSELRIFTDSIERLPHQIRISLQQESALVAVAPDERSHHPRPQRESKMAPQAQLEQMASRTEAQEQRATLQRENAKRLVEREAVLRAEEKKREENQVNADKRNREPRRELVRPLQADQSQEERPKNRKQKKERQYFGFGFER